MDSTTHPAFRRTSASLALGLIALVGACRSTPAAPHDSPREPSTAATPLASANAIPTDDPGVYRLGTVFDSIERVEIASSDGPARRLTGDEWTFDDTTGELALAAPVAATETVVILGHRGALWAWRLDPAADFETVRVLLGDEPGERDTDWALDEERRVLTFLRPELCDPARDYFVVYSLLPDGDEPQLTRAVSFGNHRDNAVVRGFLGLPAEEPGGAGPGGAGPGGAGPGGAGPGGAGLGGAESVATSIGVNAVPTDDPAVYRLHVPMQSEGLQVAIASLNEPANVRWLTAESDWTYDADEGLIRLAAVPDFDVNEEYVFVSGQPARTPELRLGKPIDPDDVTVILGNRVLEPGTDYAVNGETGTITFFTPEYLERGAQYYVQAGNLAVGNYRDYEKLKELLAQ